MTEKPRLSPLFTWRGAICDSDLHPTSRHVALTLSMHMNERGGSCFPRFDTLADETGLHYDTVRTHVRKLAAGGWLVKQTIRRGEGRGTRTEYTATVPSTDSPEQSTGAENTGGLLDDHRGANAVYTGAQDPGVEVDSESVREDDSPKPPQSGGRQTRRRQPPEPLTPMERVDDFDSWWDAYPRKIGKLDAVTAWRVMLGHLPADVATLIASAKAMEARVRREHHGDDQWQRYIPHPSTWLRRGDFLDRVDSVDSPKVRNPCVLCGVTEPCVERCEGVAVGVIDSVHHDCVWRDPS